MSREAMQMALDALEGVAQWVEKRPDTHPWDAWQRIDPAITALHQALAEPEQEPISLNNGRLTQYPNGSIGVGTPAEPEQAVAFDYSIGAERFKVVRGAYWWHVLIGDSTRKYGKFHAQADAEEMAHLLLREFRNGAFVQHGTAPTPQPEQEPVAWMQEMPVSGNEERSVRMTTVKMVADEWDNPIPLYAAPIPQREHITDGSPCWCNPDVIEEEGGNVIVHNYDDNWQQYAKPGETAQQCIERHRSEQDALMKLYATTRKPLSEQELDAMRQADGGALNFVTLRAFRVVARAVEAAHGITGETK